MKRVLSFLKPSLLGVVRDKKANNLIVALILAFSISYLISFVITPFWGGGFSGWWSMMWRQLVALGITVIVAELISRLARK